MTIEPVLGKAPFLAFLRRMVCAAGIVLSYLWAQAGVVFTSLYSFQGGTSGGSPKCGLVQDIDGNFYGTTSDVDESGTAYGNGTVFKISTHGMLTNLY